MKLNKLLLSVLLAVSLAACSSESTSNATSEVEITEKNENRKAIVEEAKRKNEERIAQHEQALQEKEEPDPVDEDQFDYLWIVDTSPREMKIHYPDCELAPEKGAMNRYETDLSTESLSKDGYIPCDTCFNWDWEELWDSYDSSESINTSQSDPLADIVFANHETWVVNKDSKKIHYPSCQHVSSIKDENRWDVYIPLDNLLSDGYTKCQTCFE